jgi:transcription antitermination factor NusG
MSKSMDSEIQQKEAEIYRLERELKLAKIDKVALSNPTWFIFRTAPQKELKSLDILENAGFIAYSPVREEYRYANKYARSKRKKSLNKFPLMVGYIFIAMDHTQLGWFFMQRKHFGLFDCVKSVVGIAGVPVSIEHSTVQSLIQDHGGGKHIAPENYRFMHTHKEFDVGDIVKVIDGPFRDREIIVSEISGKMLTAYINMFKIAHKVDIPTDYCEALD